MERLYFCTRADLNTGRQAAQLIHAMDEWAAWRGPHHGVVVVYEVADEQSLLNAIPEKGDTLLWREPDLNYQATAWATNAGRQELPLLGKT